MCCTRPGGRGGRRAGRGGARRRPDRAVRTRRRGRRGAAAPGRIRLVGLELARRWAELGPARHPARRLDDRRLARGTGNNVVHRARANGSWSAWEDLGTPATGGVLSAPGAAVRRGSGIIDVAVRAADNTVAFRSWVPGSGWQPWGTSAEPRRWRRRSSRSAPAGSTSSRGRRTTRSRPSPGTRRPARGRPGARSAASGPRRCPSSPTATTESTCSCVEPTPASTAAAGRRPDGDRGPRSTRRPCPRGRPRPCWASGAWRSSPGWARRSSAARSPTARGPGGPRSR